MALPISSSNPGRGSYPNTLDSHFITSMPKRLLSQSTTGNGISNQYKKKVFTVSGEVMSSSQHSEVASCMMSVQGDDVEQGKIKWTLALLSAMSIASILLCAVSLQYYLQNRWGEFMAKLRFVENKAYIELLKDISDCLDIGVIVCSLATFFFSVIQLLFALKMLKNCPYDLETVLEYFRKTSFLRLVIYTFWFLSLLLYIIVLLISCALDPTRGLVARGVGIALGVATMIFCATIAVRTSLFWTQITYPPRQGDYQHFSTLV